MLNWPFYSGRPLRGFAASRPKSYGDSGTCLLGNIPPAPLSSCCWPGSGVELIRTKGLLKPFRSGVSFEISPPTENEVPSPGFPQLLKQFETPFCLQVHHWSSRSSAVSPPARWPGSAQQPLPHLPLPPPLHLPLPPAHRRHWEGDPPQKVALQETPPPWVPWGLLSKS